MRTMTDAAPSDVLVVFGVTGDLAYKMIFPAVHAMVKPGVLTVPIVGVAAAPCTVAQLYVEALVAPETIKTIPDKTLRAFADPGRVNGVLPLAGGDADAVLAAFARVAVDETSLAAPLRREGAASFDGSWKDLLDRVAAKQAQPDHATAG